MAKKKKKKSKDKNKILMKGIGLHLIVYIIIGAILLLLNVPINVVAILMFVLLWGLLVISYAFYHEK